MGVKSLNPMLVGYWMTELPWRGTDASQPSPGVGQAFFFAVLPFN